MSPVEKAKGNHLVHWMFLDCVSPHLSVCVGGGAGSVLSCLL